MKKILFTLLLTVFLISKVYAEEDTTSNEYANKVYISNTDIITNIYNDLLTTYENYSEENPYYHIAFNYSNLSDKYKVQEDNSQSHIRGFLYYFTSNNDVTSDTGRIYISYSCTSKSGCIYYTAEEDKGGPGYGQFPRVHLDFTNFRNYDSNMNLLTSTGEPSVYFLTSILNKYTTVNLDDYEYIILSLKDYSQTEAFGLTLKVKGMIGITPVYEFGAKEKTDVTDRCNVSYADFTDYRFSILKNDLTNDVVYYIKACEEGSSFKFDNTIFNITYVTEENKDNVVITIDGNNYTTIPFNKLSNSANKNEENNYIPGASEQFDPFGAVGDYIKSFWNSLSTLMGLVTKFFNTLPVEIRAISITAFTTALTLGVIKFIKS